MIAEFLADLRGFFGGVDSHAGIPWFLLAVILAVYLIYRKTHS